MTDEYGRQVISWCWYCHDWIYPDEEYDVRIEDGETVYYHKECDEQKHTYREDE